VTRESKDKVTYDSKDKDTSVTIPMYSYLIVILSKGRIPRVPTLVWDNNIDHHRKGVILSL